MSLPSWARPGVKVVCVNARRTIAFDLFRELVEQQVYTIDRAFVCEGVSAVSLVETRRVIFGRDVTEEKPFAISRFRPLVAQKTLAEDVALIKSHLKAPPRSATKRRAPAEVSDA